MHGRAPQRRLSRYFTLARLIASETALERSIDNTPPLEVLPNLKLLARGLDEVRRHLGHPLEVSSAYRCPELNAAVGGALNSQHVQGLAADFTCSGYGAPLLVARALRDSPIVFDTLIAEFGEWIHLSFTTAPRRRVLTIYDTREGYLEGLLDENRQPIA